MPGGRDLFGLKSLALRVLRGERPGGRPCRVCGGWIRFVRREGRWVPVNADGSRHYDDAPSK